MRLIKVCNKTLIGRVAPSWIRFTVSVKAFIVSVIQVSKFVSNLIASIRSCAAASFLDERLDLIVFQIVINRPLLRNPARNLLIFAATTNSRPNQLRSHRQYAIMRLAWEHL
ncbi:hypothetical protein IF690_01965 [Pseudomonas sp. SK3(2021)]|uniref:hypothetical protein n=1 Tax=Pseudomonas sp. SK3(2021) TaxID=2841064 RepID=UPI00192BA8A1|nr:hypothetical protein [Pseudomonas sp. SK3(2021)]QQZ42328.1 hypothetical protein IF690_01965 [Pseudomonas sp. SK3(2021)]